MATHLGNILRMTAQWRCILVMFLLLNGIADAQVRISEFMASNAGTLADEDGLGSITYTWKANGSTVGNHSGFNFCQQIFKNAMIDR